MRSIHVGICALSTALLSCCFATVALANDECEDAILIDPNSETDFDTAGATESTQPFNPSQCPDTYFTATGPDIWFILNLESAGKLLLTTCRPGSYDTDLSLYSGTCSLMTQVACNGDAGNLPACQPFFSRIIIDVDSPGTYYVRIGGYNGEYGDGSLSSNWQPIVDCDNDGIPDTDEPDCDMDGWPDDCEADCNDNGTPDDCESWEDCNNNGIPDECDLASGNSSDINDNDILDDCESVTINVPFSLNGIGGTCLDEGTLTATMSGTVIGAKVQFDFANGGDQTWAADLLLCIDGLNEADCLQIGGYNLNCEPEADTVLEFPEEWDTTRIGSYDCYIPLSFLEMVGEGDYFIEVCHGYAEGDELASWTGSVKLLYLEDEPASCPSDINNDGVVNGADMGLMIAAWGSCPGCPADINGDDVVNGSDVGQFLASWGPCP